QILNNIIAANEPVPSGSCSAVGIFANGAVTVEGNLIAGNMKPSSGNSYGAVYLSSAGAVFRRNMVIGNELSAANGAVYTSGTAVNNLIWGNVLNGNSACPSSCFGVSLLAGGNSSVINNTIGSESDV